MSHDGKWYRIPGMPVERAPLQAPYPPPWYSAGNAHGAELAARIADIGFNYLVRQIAWGSLGHAREMHWPAPFRTEIMAGPAAA